MSPYFAAETEGARTYWCPNCKAYYYVPQVSASGCVLHSPGECCHYGESKVAGVNPESPWPRR